METISCIKTRRSIRKFKPDPITHSILEEMIETASFSPSWKNTQIVRYFAIEDSNLKFKIATECTSSHPNNGTIIQGAPVLIALTILKNRSGYERDGSFSTSKGTGWQMFDAGIAAQTFCLAAHTFGIGSVILGIFDEEKISSLLNLPPTHELAALIAIGYPDETPSIPKRKPVSDLLHFVSL